MKNKDAILMSLSSLFNMLFSVTVIYVGYSFAKLIVLFLYNNTKIQIINRIVYARNSLPFIPFLEFFLCAIGVVFIYLQLDTKKTLRLSKIFQGVAEMAGGNLNKIIEVDGSDNIGRLADNINKIVVDLKNITLEEKRAQQTKNDLITNVSHDLKTPLTSIMGYLSLVEEDKYRDELQLRYYVSIAYEKSKSLNILIQDLFELTKMQNYTERLSRETIDVVELLGQIMAQFNYQFTSAGMEVRTFFSEDKLLISGDANKLVRAFENLITNAMKYGKEGRYLDLYSKRTGDKAEISFVNYGETISALELPYIFDRFYRVEKSRNRDSGGSGLGLAITKSIIELHGGVISVDSLEGRTVFKIELPLEENYNKSTKDK